MPLASTLEPGVAEAIVRAVGETVGVKVGLGVNVVVGVNVKVGVNEGVTVNVGVRVAVGGSVGVRLAIGLAVGTTVATWATGVRGCVVGVGATDVGWQAANTNKTIRQIDLRSIFSLV